MPFPDHACQRLRDFVRLTQNIRTFRCFASLIIFDTAKLEAAFIGDFDPLEKARYTPSRPFKPGTLATYQNHSTRALMLDKADEATPLLYPGKIGRSKAVAAINEQLGLG
jgi:hypothetical protein